MSIHKTVNQNFFKKWGPEMAYVLGFFAADGNMIKNNRGAHFMEFVSIDKEIIENTRRTLNSNHKIIKRIRHEWKPSYRLQIGSKEIFNDLTRLGMTPNKSLTIKMPAIPNKYLSHFVRGYFDGDGCVYFKRHQVNDRKKPRWIFQVKFSSGSKEFLLSLQSIIKESEICKGGFISNRKSGHELGFSHYDGLALFHFMYDNVPVDAYLMRKYKTFQKAINTLHLGP